MKKVLVFGTFDGIHDGHRNMLSQAKELGSELIVALPLDSNVKQLKGIFPQHNAQIRQLLVQAENIADKVIHSDDSLGKWSILKKIKPSIVAIGYDQIALEKSLRKFIKENKLKIKLVVLESYKPEELHNRLLKC